MLGLSTRNYGQAVRTFAESYGIERSAVSEHFVRVSGGKLHELLERPLEKLKLCVMYFDGIEFKGRRAARFNGNSDILRRKAPLSAAVGKTGHGQADVLGRSRRACLLRRQACHGERRVAILDIGFHRSQCGRSA